MYEMEYEDNNYLAHHGVKGMKWGVRRYQNKDGSLTTAGRKRALKEEYKSVGASKNLTKRYIGYQFQDEKTVKKVNKAMDRLESRDKDPKYTNKQRAKDYDTAIRGISQVRDRQLLRGMREHQESGYLNDKLSRLEDKRITNSKRQDRINKKINKIVTDKKLTQIGMNEAALRYSQNSAAVNALVKRMANDKAVVYTTKREKHATEAAGPASAAYRINSNGGSNVGTSYSYNTISNTGYKVKANTKRRSNNKKYSDPNRKKEYRDRITRTDATYYY